VALISSTLFRSSLLLALVVMAFHSAIAATSTEWRANPSA
jgi:hypothetical protein